jgi:putative phosphonate transport system ATP-binding protein
MTTNPLVVARNLTKRFGDGCPQCYENTGPEAGTNMCPSCGAVVACQGVSFDVYADEILGIVGESGSGKSTLIRLLHFDWEATEGELYLKPNGIRGEIAGGLPDHAFEHDLFELNPYSRRRLRNALIGVVYQYPHLGLRMSISAGGNIAERLLTAGWRHVGRMRDRAGDLLGKTEVPVDRIDEPPKNFSGGMQQRVQIAKALSNEPMLLLLDEVTTGLDVSVQARVLDLLRQLQQELHIATIVVSHDLNVIRLLTLRTLVMRCGRIVEQGLTDQILEDPQHPYTQLLVSSAP